MYEFPLLRYTSFSGIFASSLSRTQMIYSSRFVFERSETTYSARRESREIRRIYSRAAASPSPYYANTICIFFVRMHECRIHVTHGGYVPPTSKVFDGAAPPLRTRSASVVSTRSSSNLENFFRISSRRRSRGRERERERQLRELFDADAFESQSCGFGKPPTSKLLLF